MPLDIKGVTVNPDAYPNEERYQFSLSGADDAEKAQTAKQQLSKVQEYLSQPGKTGILRLIEKKDGTFSLERKLWYQFWKSSDDYRTQTARRYIETLIDTAYLTLGNETLNKRVKRDFSAYLENRNKGIGIESLKGFLAKFTASEIYSLVTGQASSPSAAGSEGSKIKEHLFPTEVRKIHDVDKFLSDGLGVEIGEDSLGAGATANVYPVTLPSDQKSYVYKKRTAKLPEPLDLHGDEWWNHDDLAAAQQNLLKEMPQSQFFIIRVVAENSAADPDKGDLYYVPVDEIKSFGEKINQDFPKATVSIYGQLMERVPGKEVEELINPKGLSAENDNFNVVLVGLFDFVEKLFEGNFIHRDIAPKNLMLDEATRTLKIIDGGSSVLKSEKPITRVSGSREHMSPRVDVREGTYGPEVDFFSTAMTLLNVINPEEFKKFASERDLQRKTTNSEIFTAKENVGKSYLTIYLETIAGEDRSSATAKALDANPKIKELIDLAFKVSEGGPDLQANFKQWKTAFDRFKNSSSA